MKCRYKESCGYEVCMEDCCPDYKAEPKTNADHIREMSDEMLAEWLGAYMDCAVCPVDGNCIVGKSCKELIIGWLRKPKRMKHENY